MFLSAKYGFALSLVLAIAADITTPAIAQTVQSVTVAKTISNVQTDTSTVQVDPTPIGPMYGGPYDFAANVDGLNISLLSAPSIAGPISVGEPFFNNGTLLFDPTEQKWRLGFPNANDWGSPTLSDLNTKFGNGLYTFNVAGNSIPLNLTGTFPNTPILSVTGGNWVGGKYVIDVSHALTITTNAFSDYGTHTDDGIAVGIFGQFGQSFASQLHSVVPGTNFLQFTLPAFSLTAGDSYFGGAEFQALVDINPVAGLPGSLNSAQFRTNTFFEIAAVAAVPEPETYAMLLAGLGLLGFMVRRKQNAA